METLMIAAVTVSAGAFRGVTGFGYAMVTALGLSAVLMALVSRLTVGTMDPALPGLLVTYAPLTFGGFFVGHVASRHLSPQAWHRMSSGGLVLIAVIGLIQAVYSLATL